MENKPTCPFCNSPVKMYPWLLQDVLYVRCNYCHKEWRVDDGDGRGKERWKIVYEIEKENAK